MYYKFTTTQADYYLCTIVCIEENTLYTELK